MSRPPTVRKIAYSALHHVIRQEEHHSYNRAHPKTLTPVKAICAVQPLEGLKYNVECTESVRKSHEADSGGPYMEVVWCRVWYVATGDLELGSHPASKVCSVDLVVVFTLEK